MHKSIGTICIFLAALGCATPVFSQAEGKPYTTLDVAFYEAGYLYSNGKGIDRDVVDEIKNRGGYSFNYVEMPRARIWRDLEDRKLPMSVSGIQNPERDKFAYFIPYIAQKNKALVTDAKYKTVVSLVADKSAQIAVVRSFKHGEFFDGVVDTIRANGGVTEVPTIHNLFLMVKAGGRVDMIISLPVFYTKELKDLDIESKVTIYDWASTSKPIVHALILNKAHFSEDDVKKMEVIVKAMKHGWHPQEDIF